MSVDAVLESRIGRILTFGARTSSLLLAIGLVLSFGGATTVSAWIMTAGLLVLMATPVARVAASVIEYTVDHDWPFAMLTAIVFLELCAGVVAALLFHRRL
jgi:uncharacterized membrane protein